MDGLKTINDIIELFKAELESSQTVKELNDLKVKFLGKKSELSALLKSLKDLSIEEKKTLGKEINEKKKFIESEIKRVEVELQEKELEAKVQSESIDITLPGRSKFHGGLHPVSLIQKEVFDIFSYLGFTLELGPEIETDFYCFEALNIPKDHPARGMHDTFYIDENLLLRTHTSPIQIRTMLEKGAPVKILAPGRVYRSDYDSTHTPMFHQVEGLVVDKDISLADLKSTMTYFIREMFGKKLKVRFRPSYFPFTEPSSEVDMECFKCKGKGCGLCKQTGWIEILGCGMVHPKVLENSNIDPNEYTGFAFGMGIDRIAMLKYGVDDLRPMFENNINFLNQFK